MNVEFTDRYGGHHPSWLRMCHGHCEGLSVYPVYDRDSDERTSRDRADPTHGPTEVERRAVQQQIATHGRQDDGWYFIRCEACSGSGRVPWHITVMRIPRWIDRGLRFCWQMRPSSGHHPQEWSWWRKAWVVFYCAFLCDLGYKP